jgi:flavorubredoxin
LKEVGEATVDDVKNSDAVIFGCPSMGAEQLSDEMETFISKVEAENIAGKPAGAFGSYGWGDGQWMRDFITRLGGIGFFVTEEGMTIKGPPDETELTNCKEYAKKVAESD